MTTAPIKGPQTQRPKTLPISYFEPSLKPTVSKAKGLGFRGYRGLGFKGFGFGGLRFIGLRFGVFGTLRNPPTRTSGVLSPESHPKKKEGGSYRVSQQSTLNEDPLVATYRTLKGFRVYGV